MDVEPEARSIVELRLLRSFVAVAETENFGTAATRLRVTQPALTKQIQQLERQGGTALFVRGRHGAALTAAGQLVLADAVELLRRADDLDRRIRRVAEGLEGSLAVGFGMSSIDVAPQAVAAFRTAHPSVEVRLEDMSSSAQFEALETGRLTVGFVRLPAPRGITVREIHRDRLAVAVPAGEPLPDGSRNALRVWLDERPLIRLVPSRGLGLTAQAELLFTDLGCRPSLQHETSDLLTVLALVAAGVGSAIVPTSAEAIAPAGVQLLPIDTDSSEWTVGIAWHTGNADPLIPLFVDCVAKESEPG